MLDIKECRKIKRDYTKDSTEKKIIINVEGYPLCYMIITHGDGKSWGYFFDANQYIFLGRSNQLVDDANLQIKQYNAFESDYEIELIGGNDAVKSVYSRLIQYIGYHYGWCRNWHGSNDLKKAFKINPILFANIVDCGALMSPYNSNRFYYLDRLSGTIHTFDYTKPLIKDAFKIPSKWLKFLIKEGCSVEYINLLRKYNYSPEELYAVGSWYVSSIPTEVIPNKTAGLKYVSDSTYRDYCRMRTQLSDEAKHQFPIFPTNIEKHHNAIIPIYNREQIYRREKELCDKQTQYIDNFYNKASKYDYSNDEYYIKACEKLVELLLEGTTLHHCVGSYVDSVSEGKEYILFLRKVSEPDTPYFTVDVTPNGYVRQIHGLHNCNIDKNVKPFVEAWAKKFKLDISNCSGVYCALH